MKKALILLSIFVGHLSVASDTRTVYQAGYLDGSIIESRIFYDAGDHWTVVCNMKNDNTSFLSLRQYCGKEKMSECPELRKLNNLASMLVHTTGYEWRKDGLWVPVSRITRDVTKNGVLQNALNGTRTSIGLGPSLAQNFCLTISLAFFKIAQTLF